MKIEIDKPISPELRGFIRMHLGEKGMRELAEVTGVSWTTLRAITRENKPTKITQLTEPTLIPMLRLAINNKMRWAVTVREKIDDGNDQINRLTADLTDAEKGETRARLTIQQNAKP